MMKIMENKDRILDIVTGLLIIVIILLLINLVVMYLGTDLLDV